MSATKEKLHNQIESEMRKSQTVNYIKKSAVDWLKPQIELMLMDGYKPYPNQLEEAFEIAKDLENQKQGYSEEEMTEYAMFVLLNKLITPKEWLTKFKNK
jgi:hypothetical protein